MPGEWTFLSNHLPKAKAGRRNQYEVVREARFRHALEAHVTLDGFVGLVVDGEPAVRQRAVRDAGTGQSGTN